MDPLTYILLSSSSSSEESSQAMEMEASQEEESFLSPMDYVLLLLVCILGYWYFFKDDSTSITTANSFKFDLMPDNPSGLPGGGSESNKSFLSKMKNKKRRMVVFYGSQTGTAEEFAGRLANEGIRYGLKGVVADPEETDMEDLTKLGEVSDFLDGSPTLAVFCLATYGEGDPTDNAQEFFEWLQGGNVDLNTMTFAVSSRPSPETPPGKRYT
uniref:NADPH--cytochrome P450 reductase n=1 Tax=Caligus clemensi TaxID=344056 RepID=C1C308_CALCM|nr:NADPH--cytochrome P450 reductase [Caligus clemensi]